MVSLFAFVKDSVAIAALPRGHRIKCLDWLGCFTSGNLKLTVIFGNLTSFDTDTEAGASPVTGTDVVVISTAK
jgi:hypothetical protein